MPTTFTPIHFANQHQTEFQTSLSAPQPLYADFLLGTRFYTVLTLHHGGAPSIPLIFGSKETTFPSKKAAQQHASKLAVQHLQSTGLWPETDSAGIRKKKKNNTPAQEHTDGGKENLPPSYAARATSLATQLHLGAPQYRWASKPKAPDFHDVAAFFPSAGGAGSSELEGPVGQVRNVHGKKRAKEECAKLVVRVLEGVRERRERELRDVFGEGGAGGRKGEVRMMVDLKGMKGVEKGDDGVGKEREREMRGVGVGQDDGEDEYDDETFEDAVEEVVKAGV